MLLQKKTQTKPSAHEKKAKTPSQALMWYNTDTGAWGWK